MAMKTFTNGAMALPSRLLYIAVLTVLATLPVQASLPDSVRQLALRGYVTTRRLLNFNNLLGSRRGACAATNVYDTLAGHPVFAVTTPYGSPYLNMEKLTDLDEVVPADQKNPLVTRAKQRGYQDDSSEGVAGSSMQPLSEDQSEVRTVALYFMDPDEAVSARNEMSMLEQLSKQDIRVTTFSLTKALRHVSHVGYGLLTGQPADANTGVLSVLDGTSGSLRYKIVPSKRQLYYAARCMGRERVGLSSDQPVSDAVATILGNSAIEMNNIQKRREKRERKTPKSRKQRKDETELSIPSMSVPHMEGYTGIPVFFCHNMRKKLPLVKQLATGVRYEIPLFFNYEDLESAYEKVVRKESKRRSADPPSTKPVVEVFNLWDVITSVDRQSDENRHSPMLAKPKTGDSWLRAKSQQVVSSILPPDPWGPLRRRFSLLKSVGPLEHESNQDLMSLVFVPNSRAVLYKESMSRRGNGKARLRPLR
jgi:hypothetical protein